MSYILQRRVGTRVMKVTIGNYRDIPLVKAREAAKAALEDMRASRAHACRSPRSLQRGDPRDDYDGR